MKPFSRYFALFGIGAAWLTAAAIPAMAQAITTATATLSCGPRPASARRLAPGLPTIQQ
jgi:hypothetical protein